MKKKNMFSELEAQIGLNNFFPLFDPFGMRHESQVLPEDNADSNTSAGQAENYMLLGQKLLTLARESAPKHREYTDLSKKLTELTTDLAYEVGKEGNVSFGKLMDRLSSAFRSVLKKMGDDVYGSDTAAELHKLMPHIAFTLCTCDEYENKVPVSDRLSDRQYLPHTSIYGIAGRRGRKFEAGEKVLYLICPQLFNSDIYIGYQKAAEKRSNGYYRLSSDHAFKIVNMSQIFVYMYMAEVIISNYTTKDFRDSVLSKEIFAGAGLAYSYYPRSGQKILSSGVKLPRPVTILSKDTTVIYLSDGDDEDQDIKRYLRGRCGRLFIMGGSNFNFLDTANSELAQMLREHIPSEDMEHYEISTCDGSISAYKLFDKLMISIKTHPTINAPIFLTSDQVVSYMVWDSQHSDFSDDDLSILMKEMTCRKRYCILPSNYIEAGYHRAETLFMALYLSINQILSHEVREMDREYREQSEHARSFEDKKNVPVKIQKLMQESELNKRFGYVEYDEMCDTSKIQVVNAQLLMFVNQYFPQLDLKSISIRFRRLGHYKACGVYFSFYRCIAIDLSHPSSFVHEFGHMLDYTQGGLSNCLNSRDFEKVYKMYVDLIDKKLEESGEAAVAHYKKGGKKSKYNYYTRETEVFANSFEVYISDVLHLSNTIIESPEEYEKNPLVYHMENEEYMQLVRDYFSQLPCMSDLVSYIYDDSDSAA